jgi:hypothetical protein
LDAISHDITRLRLGMPRQRDDQEEAGEHDVDRQHDLSFEQAPRSCGEDERREKESGVDIAGGLRGEHRNHEQDVRALQRHENAEQASDDRQEGVRTKPRLEVVVLAAPGEAREGNSKKQDQLERCECQQCNAADNRDDLGHALTVTGSA